MKHFNDISFNEIDSSEEYYMFEYESLRLSLILGSDLITLICDKFDYEEWKVENEDEGDIESFLDWSSGVNDEDAGNEWIGIYEKD